MLSLKLKEGQKICKKNICKKNLNMEIWIFAKWKIDLILLKNRWVLLVVFLIEDMQN